MPDSKASTHFLACIASYQKARRIFAFLFFFLTLGTAIIIMSSVAGSSSRTEEARSSSSRHQDSSHVPFTPKAASHRRRANKQLSAKQLDKVSVCPKKSRKITPSSCLTQKKNYFFSHKITDCQESHCSPAISWAPSFRFLFFSGQHWGVDQGSGCGRC